MNKWEKSVLTEKKVLLKNVTMQFSKMFSFLHFLCQFFATTEENKALFGWFD